MTAETWHAFVACAGMDWFRMTPEQCKDTCAVCPVSEACKAEAHALPELAGVWGGETEEERLGVRRRIDRVVVPRSCAVCGELFTPESRGMRQTPTCSEACGEARRSGQRAKSTKAVKESRPSMAKPCAKCGTTQNMKDGTCQGWECLRAKKVEVMRDVMA